MLNVFHRYISLVLQNAALRGNGLMNPRKRIFEHILGKDENTGNQHFTFFHNVFYYVMELGFVCNIFKYFVWRMLTILKESKNLLFWRRVSFSDTIYQSLDGVAQSTDKPTRLKILPDHLNDS